MPDTWDDLEYVMSTHTVENLFLGRLPTQPEDFYKRFRIVMGASAVNFARSKRVNRTREFSEDASLEDSLWFSKSILVSVESILDWQNMWISLIATWML